jgi:hypothetical protein
MGLGGFAKCSTQLTPNNEASPNANSAIGNIEGWPMPISVIQVNKVDHCTIHDAI